MFLEAPLVTIEADPELVVVASRQLTLVAAVLNELEEASPLAIQMVTLAALKEVYCRNGFVTDKALELAVAAAFEHLKRKEEEV